MQLQVNPFLLLTYYPGLLGREEREGREAWVHILGKHDNSPALPGRLTCFYHRPSAKKQQLGFL